MSRAHEIEVGWFDADENDYRVTLSYSGGSRGSRYEPPEGPEVEVIAVVEDREGGASRPDLIPIVEAELDGRWGDKVTDAIGDDEVDRYADAMERRTDAAREEGRI